MNARDIPLCRYEINGKEIWLIHKTTLLRVIGTNTFNFNAIERRGVVPKSIFRKECRGWNARLKAVLPNFRNLYTREHFTLIVTFINTVSNGRFFETRFRPTEKQLAMFHAEWEALDKKYIEEYQLSTESSVYICQERALKSGKIKDPDLTLRGIKHEES
jgi:hypothetical protein